MGATDSHVHVWDPARHRHAWLDSEPTLNRAVLPSEIDFASADVSRAVFVQADAAESVSEAAWVASLDWPELAGIVAHAPVETERAAAVLDALGDIPLVVGVRRLLQDEPLDFFASSALRAGLAQVAARGLAFDACVRHPQLVALHELARSLPQLEIVLDHLGKPPVAAGIDSDAGRGWLSSITRLAELDNVVVKLSGLAPEADTDQELAPQARPFLDAALTHFGAQRCLIGSDWPVSGAGGLGYADWFSLVLDGLGLSSAERHAVSVATASVAYGIPLTPLTESSTRADRELYR